MNKLRMMIRIRLFEQMVSQLKLSGEIEGAVHTCIGQEAISAGVCMALAPTDYIIGNHRSHGYMIAKGADPKALMAEIFGKVTGTNRGKGGSMHVNDVMVGGMGSTAIVGSGLPLACGVAFASKYINNLRITCVFFGDGAVNEGTFYECLNLASLWKLPVIFFLENNGVAVTTLLKNVSGQDELVYRGYPFEINRHKIYGQDVEEVFNVTIKAVSEIKTNGNPVLIEAQTFRFHEHQEGAAYERMKETKYRDNNEVKYWTENRDPITLYSDKLIREKVLTKEEIDAIYMEEMKVVADAVVFARESEFNQDAYKNIFA